jgi:hypothetical protein
MGFLAQSATGFHCEFDGSVDGIIIDEKMLTE